MNWFLENAREANKKAPYTFYIPSEEVIRQLSVGDLVKLIFVAKEPSEDGMRAERMWVEITSIEGTHFIGRLDNEPYHVDIEPNTVITFNREHICSTEHDDPANEKWDFYFDTLVTVSNDVLDRREVNFMLRDEPHEEGDSGWSLLSGYEDDDYLADHNNFQIVSLGVVLNMDDTVLDFFHDPPLCAYERDEQGNFYKIKDYDWDQYLNN